MSGGTIQLLKLGEEDKFLIGNPQITFFKTVYKRHSNFAIGTKKWQFNGVTNYGNTCSLNIPKDGDLLSGITLNIELPNLNTDSILFSYANSIGHLLIEETWIEIGGHKIEKIYGDWSEIWSELALDKDKRDGYYEITGKKERKDFSINSFNSSIELFLPLNFWFSRNFGLSLPLIGLM